MIKISVSEKRNPVPRQVAIGDHTTLTSWGAIKVGKSHFFPSSFQVMAEDRVIYIDPVEIGNAPPADFILITHAHPDHLSIKDIKALLKEETVIVCPKSVAKKLKSLSNKVSTIKPAGPLQLAGLHVRAVPAYNTKSVFLWIKAHPRSKGNVGFVLSLKNGLRLYHAGDTDYVPEMAGLQDIDVVLVPIGGDNLTMDEAEAARIVNEIGPGIAVPMHYELKDEKELQRFEALVDQGITVLKLS